MIRVTIGSNTSRNTIDASPDATPRQLFEAQGIDISSGSVHLNGATIRNDKLDQPLADLVNGADHCSLISVIKGDAARK